jgi:hypothetical protein
MENTHVIINSVDVILDFVSNELQRQVELMQ